MAEKITTLGQMKRLALRGRADSAALYAELAGLMAAGLEDARAAGFAVALPQAGWNGGVQTVQHPSLLADSGYWYLVFGGEGVQADGVFIDGEITFRCNNTLEKDLTVYILRLEVGI